jgi:hypothetical protein
MCNYNLCIPFPSPISRCWNSYVRLWQQAGLSASMPSTGSHTLPAQSTLAQIRQRPRSFTMDCSFTERRISSMPPRSRDDLQAQALP